MTSNGIQPFSATEVYIRQILFFFVVFFFCRALAQLVFEIQVFDPGVALI